MQTVSIYTHILGWAYGPTYCCTYVYFSKLSLFQSSLFSSGLSCLFCILSLFTYNFLGNLKRILHSIDLFF